MLTSVSESVDFSTKVKAYWQFLKPRLSFLVAFSASFGYIFANKGQFDWFSFLGLSIGGFLVSGASVGINQILEKDLDILMKRTQKRPIPLGLMSVQEANIYTVLVAFAGFALLGIFTNVLTVSLSVLSLILYGFVYTPLKQKGSVAVFVGAIPGALPPLLGWVAATNEISFEALIIFAVQFIWQFPHFWAIAWVLDEDYQKAGFRLLPSQQGRSINSAIQIMVYTLFLIPISLLPALFGLTGITSAIVVTMAGCLFAAQSFSLMRSNEPKSALKIMFASFLYLPIVQIAYLLDKI
ncbi:MAG: heme o synthase [Thermonemataceae bacterium]|nr:heme o synthase [Thermonemataceae bacterium]